MKFGYAVTGEVDPSAIWSNAGAQAGDVLVLTKPLGTGVMATALKFGRAPADAVDAADRVDAALNRVASEVLRGLPGASVHACTDITGFGLIGHASEMAAASGVTVRIESAAVPLLPGVIDLVAGNIPGGGRTNASYFGPYVRVADGLDPRIGTTPERPANVRWAARGHRSCRRRRLRPTRSPRPEWPAQSSAVSPPPAPGRS